MVDRGDARRILALVIFHALSHPDRTHDGDTGSVVVRRQQCAGDCAYQYMDYVFFPVSPKIVQAESFARPVFAPLAIL